MQKLSYAISKVIVNEYGQHEFLRRLADPLWFQVFGCVLGFDWSFIRSYNRGNWSLKHSLNEDVHGVSIAGGKGKRSRKAKNEIPNLAEKHYNLSSAKMENLLCASRITAKVDNSAVLRMVFHYITM